eukprot:CAMPEP_0185033188 /NCGR_PEP_ID=MMETSP1103-20130426/21950_1 /TAXON_ID=36769 /ORGANISM="Paraphysomonas bandaiensis, Strain Caron Lab Isolate" /LENGTH=298 /DNA_ID=CAMNT_0027569381 /DNA_START=87 /DNA_END=979 /DNA_ORIENTATION=-
MRCVVWVLYMIAILSGVKDHFGLSYSISMVDILPHQIALLQYDSRPLSDYWLSSALWNNYYAKIHGHVFLYYSLAGRCRYGDTDLADAWCKVKAMLQAHEEHPDIKVFIYMDSDAVISQGFKDRSLNDLLQIVQNKLDWDPSEKPMMFNQDGPCWWCNLIQKVGYETCLNAGTVLWYRHHYSEEILNQWWHSTMDSYADNPLKRKFRTNWPWEQDRQMAIYHRSPEHIQIASQPDSAQLVPKKGMRVIDGWCLSHLPGWGCFISHHCANPASKQKLRELYNVPKEFSTSSVNGLPFQV